MSLDRKENYAFLNRTISHSISAFFILLEQFPFLLNNGKTTRDLTESFEKGLNETTFKVSNLQRGQFRLFFIARRGERFEHKQEKGKNF